MALRHYDIVAWQRADDLDLHTLTRQLFPADERYELTAQLRRAAFSMPANIGEGFARAPGRGRLQFLRVSWASLAEVGYCLHAVRRLHYLNTEKYKDLNRRVEAVAAPLMGLVHRERQ